MGRVGLRLPCAQESSAEIPEPLAQLAQGVCCQPFGSYDIEPGFSVFLKPVPLPGFNPNRKRKARVWSGAEPDGVLGAKQANCTVIIITAVLKGIMR